MKCAKAATCDQRARERVQTIASMRRERPGGVGGAHPNRPQYTTERRTGWALSTVCASMYAIAALSQKNSMYLKLTSMHLPQL